MPFALSCAFDAVVVGAAVVWLLRRPSGIRLAAGAVSVLAVLVVKGVAMDKAGLDDFGAIHVLWLDLVVVAPLAGLLVLVLARGQPNLRALRVVAALTLLLAPLGVYGSFVEPNRLVVERATLTVPPERAGNAPVRVGIVSDLQFSRVGDHQREAVARLMRERPDVILVPGDLHQGSAAELAREIPATRRLLRGLRAPGGVFFVQGDVESLGAARTLLAGTGVRMLVDTRVRVRVRDRTLSILGTRRDFGSPSARAATHAFDRAPGRADVRILLTHRPDPVLTLRRGTRIDLVAAGHTHGGQVQLPLLGPPTVASEVPRDVGAGGLHDLGGGRRIYVTRGVGAERGQAPLLRIGAVPEVSVVTLR